MVIFSESQSVGVLRHHWSICHPSSVCFPACSDFKPCRAACCDGSVSVSVCRNGHKLSKMFLVWTEPTVLFFTVPAGDGQRREELLPGHTQTDQEENQRVQALPPGPLQQLLWLAGRSGADGQVERSSSLFWTLCCSLSGWDGPDSGETVSVRTAESESESQRREALRLVTDLSDAAGHFSCSSPSCQHFLFVFCVRDIVLILLPTVFCVLNGKHVFFKYKYDWNSLKLVWRMFFFLQDENILAETHCRVWSAHSLSGRVSDLNLNQNTLMMMMMMMIYMRGVWLQFHVFKLHWSLNM